MRCARETELTFGSHAVSAYVLEPLEEGDLLSLGKLPT